MELTQRRLHRDFVGKRNYLLLLKKNSRFNFIKYFFQYKSTDNSTKGEERFKILKINQVSEIKEKRNF